MTAIIALVIGAAALGALAAGRWIRARAKKSAPGPTRPRHAMGMDDGAPLSLGDVVVLDEGRGRELWMARVVAFAEAGADPFLYLFEAEGPKTARAIVAWDPLVPEDMDLLTPHPSAERIVLADRRASRPPTAIDVEIEGRSLTLSLARRHTARATAAAVPEDEGGGGLPPAGGALLVAIYRGDVRGCAVVVRDDDDVVHAYVGRTHPLRTTSVLRNRPTPTRTPSLTRERE